MNSPNKLLVVPVHLDALHLSQGSSARAGMADFTNLPYLKKNSTGQVFEVNGDRPHISQSVNTPHFDTGFWLRPGIHLHWSLPDGLTVGKHSEEANQYSQPIFPAVPNRWLVQRRYQNTVQKRWLVESDFLYDPDYWDRVAQNEEARELQRYLVAYPLPIEEEGQPPFRYMGRQTEFKVGKTDLAEGAYLAGFLESLEKKGIDISDYPKHLTAIGHGEKTFAAFYPNSHSVFGLYDADFGTVAPPKGICYEVYGWYERTESSNNLVDDPIYQLTKNIPTVTNNDTFDEWFEKTQNCIERLENFYRWRASFEISETVVKQVNSLITNILQEKNIDFRPIMVNQIVRGRQALQEYITDPEQGNLSPLQAKSSLNYQLSTNSNYQVSLETLIASCALQIPEQLICYGQVCQGSFVSKLSSPQTQIFVGNTGTEAVAAFTASELAVARYPHSRDRADSRSVSDAYAAVQIKEKERLERFIEATHLTTALKKQRVDIGFRLSEERHTKTFTAHAGSQLWVVKSVTSNNAEQDAASLENGLSTELNLPEDLAHELNTINALQTEYDRSLHTIEAVRRQIYADWYRYMLLAYPSDDEALNYESIRLSPDVDGMITYIKQRDITLLEQVITEAGIVRGYSDRSDKNSASDSSRWHCDWYIDIKGSETSLAYQLKAAIAKFCQDLNTHNQNQTTPNSENQWVLARTVGPRFWSPNEPVLLLSHLESSDRHGADGRFSDDRRLVCPVVRDVQFPPADLRASQTDNAELIAELSAVQEQLQQQIDPLLSPYYRRKQSSQSHPFMMEWEVQLSSVRPPAYISNPDLAYQPDEIQNNWSLGETDTELTEVGHKLSIPQQTISFTGNSLLLDYAGMVVDEALETYLLNSLDDYFLNFNIPTEAQKEHLRTNAAQIRNWLITTTSDDNLEAIAVHLAKIDAVFPESVYGLKSSGKLTQDIEDFLAEYQTKTITLEIQQLLQPLMIVPSESDMTTVSDNVLAYLLGLESEEQVSTFVEQVKNNQKRTKKHPEFLLTPERWAVILRYADALGYTNDQSANNALYRENVLWRSLVMGLPDGGALASAILSIVNLAAPAQLTQIGLSDLVNAEIQAARAIKPFESLNQLVSLQHFDESQMAELLYHLEDPTLNSIIDWNRSQFNGADEQGHYWVDSRLTAFDAWQTLTNTPGLLTFTLDGFNNTLLSKQSTWQLPVADPLGFSAYQAFSEITMKPLVGRQTEAPLPSTPFSPIRGGHFNVALLRLVDTFGQYTDIDTTQIRTTEQMRSQSVLPVCVPPRLVQPARLNARWLDADPPSNAPYRNEQEWNAHPASSPICGWVLPNMLDARLMIYDRGGQALGSLDRTGTWRPKPGSNSIAIAEDIPNLHLRRMVLWLRDRASADGDWRFMPEFVDVLDSALEYIDPDGAEQSSALSILIGRPLALIRASLSLELQEPYAVQQSLAAFSQTLGGARRKTQGFEKVQFPVRLGEHHRFQDGLVGYWEESSAEQLGDIFYAPQSDWITDELDENIRIYRRQDGAFNISLALSDAPKTVSMLMDVRGSLHITSGILPTKELKIPDDLVSQALQAIAVTFLTAPILTPKNKLQVSLPHLNGWQWSWVSRQSSQWSTQHSTPTVYRLEAIEAFPQDGIALWNALLQNGVLSAIPGESKQAFYDAKQLESGLDLIFTKMTPPETKQKVTYQSSDFNAEREDVKRFLQIKAQCIESMGYEAKFSPQVLREGWLQLSPATAQSNALFDKNDFLKLFTGDRGTEIWQELIAHQVLKPFVPHDTENLAISTTQQTTMHRAVLNRAKLRDYIAQSNLDLSETETSLVTGFFSQSFLSFV